MVTNLEYLKRPREKAGDCVVLGNGPSLASFLAGKRPFLEDKTIICVNDFFLSPYFLSLKPSYYILADHAYWSIKASSKSKKLQNDVLEAIKNKVQWPMSLVLPLSAKIGNPFAEVNKLNSNISLIYYNDIELSRPAMLRNYLYSRGFFAPRIQNVLHAAILSAIRLGYKNIYVLGADHSWHESIHVGDDNILYWKDQHFYDNNVNLTPIYKDVSQTAVFNVAEIFFTLSKVYNSYYLLNNLAMYSGSHIINVTEKSYIDAFDRKRINK